MLRKVAIAGCVVPVILLGIASLLRNADDGTKSLEYVAIGIDENRTPVVLGIKVKNDHYTPVSIVGCDATVPWKFLLSGEFTQENFPKDFKFSTTLFEQQRIEISANSTSIVSIAFHWNLDATAPPAVAACQAIFTLQSTTEQTIITEPVTFVVTHRGDDPSIRKSGGFHIETSLNAAESFLASIGTIRGKRSEKIQYLVNVLKAQSDEQTEETILPSF